MANTRLNPSQSIASIQSIVSIDAEQLPVAPHKLYGWGHFAAILR